MARLVHPPSATITAGGMPVTQQQRTATTVRATVTPLRPQQRLGARAMHDGRGPMRCRNGEAKTSSSLLCKPGGKRLPLGHGERRMAPCFCQRQPTNYVFIYERTSARRPCQVRGSDHRFRRRPWRIRLLLFAGVGDGEDRGNREPHRGQQTHRPVQGGRRFD
jgi:hypothetical protein